MIHKIVAVLTFEWKRSLTWPRMGWWVALTAFPVFIVGLVRFTAFNEPPFEFWSGLLFALFPMLVTIMGTLLWCTPAISDELERRSWIYLAVRPNASSIVMLGKYLAAVSWVIPPAILGLCLAVPIVNTTRGWLLWWTMVRLVCLACPTYAAIYLLIGVIIPRRAFVAAVAYTLIFELVLSFIPALINRVTAQFHLRALLVHWCQLPLPSSGQVEALALIGDQPPWQHVSTLILIWPMILSIAVLVLYLSEFSSAAETDV